MDRVWVSYCAIGELLGFTAAALFNVVHLQLIGEPATLIQQITVILLATLGGIAEGSILAWFQWQRLSHYLPDLSKSSWIKYTAFIAGIGWFLGMIYPTFFPPTTSSSTSSTSFDPPIWLMTIAGLVMGIVLGLLFGAVQSLPLRGIISNPSQWIIANCYGWGVAMIILMLGPSLIPAGSSIWVIITVASFCGIVAGIAIGLITGLFLLNLNLITN